MSLAEGTAATGQMLSITREFRHFESIFLWPTAAGSRWRARVFDLDGELDFAGHPVLGAAAVLHDRAGGDATRQWTIELSAKTVTLLPVNGASAKTSTCWNCMSATFAPELAT